jgi:hypothetical protein
MEKMARIHQEHYNNWLQYSCMIVTWNIDTDLLNYVEN